jgi:HAD superfamily hydrolase (TIGR01549 family)
MFALMRTALQIPKSVDILGHIHSLPESEQEAAHEAIKQIERDAMVKQTPQPGLVELMTYLDSRGLPKGILTRNFDAPVTHLLEKFLPEAVFEPIITRSFHPPKPRPEGIWHIVEKWGMGVGAEGAKGVIMVGDSLDDMTAGRLAGAATVLLRNDVNGEVAEHEHTDLVVSRLDDLVKILEGGFRGREI